MVARHPSQAGFIGVRFKILPDSDDDHGADEEERAAIQAKRAEVEIPEYGARGPSLGMPGRADLSILVLSGTQKTRRKREDGSPDA